MAKPKIAWMPVRLIHPILSGQMSVEEWIRSAPAFGVGAVEIYHAFLSDEKVPELRRLLDHLGLSVSQITCAPDFTNPDPTVRQRELDAMRQRVDWAVQLGADAVRTTAGINHPELSEEDGVRYAVEQMVCLAEYSVPLGVYPCYENHYRDRLWHIEDFSFRAERFLRIFEAIEPTEVRVNFDFANPLMTGADPVALLQRVLHKVHHIHAGDRMPGSYQHSILGEGRVPFRELLSLLSQHGYSGYLSIEDGQAEGDEGFRRSLKFLNQLVDEIWRDESA